MYKKHATTSSLREILDKVRGVAVVATAYVPMAYSSQDISRASEVLARLSAVAGA